jgi:hypothetical protein
MTIVALCIVTAFGLAGLAVAVYALHAVGGYQRQWAAERERLLTAVMSPDALLSLQRLETTTRGMAASAEARAAERLDRRLDAFDDDQHLEHIGGIG